jgi:hypothetical protein
MQYRLLTLSLLLGGLALGGFCLPVSAGEVVVTLVDVYPQAGLLMKKVQQRQLKMMIEQYGEKEGERMFAQINRPYFTVYLENEDRVRRATRIEVQLHLFDDQNRPLGEEQVVWRQPLGPGGEARVVVYPDELRTEGVGALSATIGSVAWEAVDFGTDELVFEHDERRWFVENEWANSGRIVVRSFSREAYSDDEFEDRVFPGRLAADESRYYRVARQPLPFGFGEGETEPSLEWYTLLPGIVVEGDAARPPKFLNLGDAGIVTSGVAATLEIGQYVQIKEVELEKKGFKLIVGPVCRNERHSRRLRSRVRFVVGKAAMSGPRMETLEATVRPWLEPVPASAVAQVCGPRFGALVRRWDSGTTQPEIVAALGEPSERSGDILVYGPLRLRLAAGALAGVETLTTP